MARVPPYVKTFGVYGEPALATYHPRLEAGSGIILTPDYDKLAVEISLDPDYDPPAISTPIHFTIHPDTPLPSASLHSVFSWSYEDS